MNPLLGRLAWLRRRLVVLTGVRGILAVLALVLGLGLLAGLLDWWLMLPSLVRAVLLAAILTGGAYVLFRLFLQPLLAPKDDLSLALKVEQHFPQLNDCLASTVQFLRQPSDSATAGSAAMRQKAVEQAFAKSEGCDFRQILDRRGALAALGAFVLVAAAVGHFAYHHTDHAFTATKRLADPFGNHTWTRVNMEAPRKVPVERLFQHQARVEGVIPKNARIEVEGKKPENLVIEHDAEGAFLTVKLPYTKEPGEFRFRIAAGDGSYPAGPGEWHTVQVLTPPSVTEMTTILEFPAYTEEPPADLTPPVHSRGLVHLQHMHFVPGSVARLSGTVDRPLAEAWIEYRPRDGSDRVDSRDESLRSALVAGIFGAPLGFEGLPLAAGGFSVYGRFPARYLDDSKQKIAFDLQPWLSGSYRLYLKDADDLDREYTKEVNLEFDTVPAVRLRLDSPHIPWDKPVTAMDVRPDAQLDFLITASEEKYWLRDVFLEFAKSTAEDGPPLVVPVFDHAEMGRIAPALMAGLATTLPAGDIKIRWQRLERLPAHWGLGNRFKEGEIVSVRAAAHDFCNVFANREPGRSEEIKLRIVGVKDLLRAEERVLPDVQVDIEDARAKMENALDLLKKALEKNEFDDIRRAMEDQKSAKARLEKLLEDVNQRMTTRKINKLPFSESGDITRTLREELESLVENDLPELEDQIHKAVAKMLAAPEKDKKTEKDKEGKDKEKAGGKEDNPLAKAVDLQEKANDTLRDLSRMLDPFANMETIKAKARDLLLKQEDIRAATEKLQELKEKMERGEIGDRDKRRAEKEFKDEINRQADAQSDLGAKADELLKMLADAAKKRDAGKDRESAAKLEKAHDIGTSSKLSDKMRDAGSQLKKDDPLLHKAIREQDQIKATLGKLNDALNDKKKTDDVDRLTKKRKVTNENLDKIDKLREDLDNLRGKVAKAMEIKDDKMKAEALGKLAKEEERIKKDLEEAARELARLNEPRAAKALAEAAKELEKAGEKMKAGGDPGENIDAAMEKLNDANDKLAEERDELAREQLAQIADLIKGLKERQDEAIVRQDELQKRVMERKIWSEGLLDTLSGGITTQDGLAKEVRGLKEKLKDAIVFEHIMEKAAHAMERAVEAMEHRKDEAKQRQIDMMVKEELDDEVKRHEEIKKHQQLASSRLDRLLESIKNEMPKKDVAKKDDEPAKKDDAPKVDGGGGGGGPGDAIPPIAQLKALKSEQMEIRERTKTFDDRFPDRQKLPPEAERELRELQDDQIRIHQLFERMTTPPEKKGA